MGDPGSIGPEILWDAYQKVSSQLVFDIEIFGDPRVYELLGIKISDSFLSHFSASLDWQSLPPVQHIGVETTEGGIHALAYLNASVQAVKDGRVNGLVSGPVSKNAVSKIAPGFRGHTYFYEDCLLAHDRQRAVMSFFGQRFSLILLTHHIPLTEVSSVLHKMDLVPAVHMSLRDFSKWIPDLKVGVCGFNPHAGEEGLLDCGEDQILRSMVTELRKLGWQIENPLPADTLFCDHVLKDFNMVISAYHDQGLIPFKMAHFPRGLGVTLGLRVPRLSVDHGTAFSIAGKQLASSLSLQEAMLLMTDHFTRITKLNSSDR